MGIMSFLNKIFSEPPDPLDDLLIEKGVDPQQLLVDVKLKREEEGEESGVNRALERRGMQQKQAGEKIRNMMSN